MLQSVSESRPRPPMRYCPAAQSPTSIPPGITGLWARRRDGGHSVGFDGHVPSSSIVPVCRPCRGRAEHRGLAGSVGSDDVDPLACVNVEGDILQMRWFEIDREAGDGMMLTDLRLVRSTNERGTEEAVTTPIGFGQFDGRSGGGSARPNAPPNRIEEPTAMASPNANHGMWNDDATKPIGPDRDGGPAPAAASDDHADLRGSRPRACASSSPTAAHREPGSGDDAGSELGNTAPSAPPRTSRSCDPAKDPGVHLEMRGVGAGHRSARSGSSQRQRRRG